MQKATLLYFLLMTTTTAWPQTSPSFIFFTDTELRHSIQTATEQVAGQPGLYALRLSRSQSLP